MSFVFINCTGDTFTPTKSGAISTWIWEMCSAAKADGIEPLVISRRHDVESYQWPRLTLLDYPRIPAVRGVGRALHLHQRWTGWGHIRQGAYVRRVADAIRAAGMKKGPFVLHNDIEMTVYLREQFPDARILHHSHNCNPCSEKFHRRFASAVDAATAVSRYCGEWNERYFGFPEGGIRTIHNGVDSRRFSPATEQPGGLPVINFVGRTDSSKAPDLILKAARELSRTRRDFEVQILGSRHYGWQEDDAYQIELRQLAGDLERDGIRVRAPGFIGRQALPDELRKAHIHVVPSRWDEPCALTIFEGMAAGLPIVASRTGGTPEIVGDAGFLFERDGVSELAGHLCQLIEDSALRAEYARKSRARAEELTWDKTWDELRQVIGV